jgi:hypothetical protein
VLSFNTRRCLFVVIARSERLYRDTVVCRQNRCRGTDLVRRKPGMSPETTAAWRRRGGDVLGYVRAAERRLSGSLGLNDVMVLAAADGLSAATKVATAWLAANPCPDPGLGRQMARMLNSCAEVALTAQRVETDPQSDSETVRSRIENLAAVIRIDALALDAW